MLETLFLVSQGISAAGTIMGGIGAQQEARLNAFNTETEKVQNKTQAEQAALARRQEYDLATQSNIAAFSAMGRDEDRSVEAFLKRQKEIFGQDVGRVDRQTYMEGLAFNMKAMNERRRGRNALMSSIFDAASIGASTITGYKSITT